MLPHQHQQQLTQEQLSLLQQQQLQLQQLQNSSCNVSTSMNFWSAIGNRLSSLMCRCCERKLPDPENV